MQSTRRATGHSPLREGGWRGHEWKADAWQKTSGKGRDGGSTAVGRRGKHDFPPATSETIPLRMDHAKACIDGHPHYSPRRPFLPLRTCNPQAIFLWAAPPSRSGANARGLSILRISLHDFPAILPVHYPKNHVLPENSHPAAWLKAAPPSRFPKSVPKQCGRLGRAALCRGRATGVFHACPRRALWTRPGRSRALPRCGSVRSPRGGPRFVAAARTGCFMHAPEALCGHGPDEAGPSQEASALSPRGGTRFRASAVEQGATRPHSFLQPLQWPMGLWLSERRARGGGALAVVKRLVIRRGCFQEGRNV